MAFLMMRTALSLFKLAWPILSVIWVATPAQAGDDSIIYQKRGHYWEGRKEEPVGGFGLVLLAAQAKANSQTDKTSKQFHARFYLAKPQMVYLTVYEPKKLYWLDKVEPTQPWQPSFYNEFQWPTEPVIDKLGLQLGDLNAIVRLDHDKPNDEETVAPVLLYSSPSPPQRIAGYAFSFYLHKAAKLNWQVLEKNSGKEIAKGELGEKPSGKVFDFDVPATNQQAGDYCLVLSGRLQDNSNRVAHTVYFHHQPVVQ